MTAPVATFASRDTATPLLAGELSGFALADVLQLLELGARTGVLVVDGGPLGGGRVRLRDGRVVSAAYGAHTSAAPEDLAEAFAGLLAVGAGRWAFHAAGAGDAGNSHAAVGRFEGVRVSAILVDAARRRDERVRAAVGEQCDVPRLATDVPNDDSEGASLTAFDLAVLAAVDGTRDTGAIARAVRRDEPRVRDSIETLRRLGIVCACETPETTGPKP